MSEDTPSALNGLDSDRLRAGAAADIFQKAFELSPEAMCIVSREDGKMLALNASFERIFGYTRDEALGKSSLELGLWASPETRDQIVVELDRDGRVLEREYTFRTKSGEERQGLLSAANLQATGARYTISITRDTTESKRKTQALAENKEQLQQALDAARMGTFAWEVRTGNVSWSENVANLLGMSSGDVPDQHLDYHELIHPDDRPLVAAAMKRALDNGEAYEVEHRNLLPDGRTLWIHGKGKVFFDDDGDPVRVQGTIADITDRKLNEAALEESQAQLKQAQKMEAIGRLAGGVAHDFNNILTIISGYSDLILGKDELPRETRERIEEIAKASERAASLTRQLLAFSRRQVLQPQVLRFNDVLADMETMISRIIGEDIHLESSYAPDAGYVLADPGQMEQVILNLAVNARDAMPVGGTLRVSTESIDIDRAAAAAYEGLTPGNYVLLAVRDTGEGIAEDDLPQVFQPFFTTKARGRGTGLGLATVYGIVKQSDGYVYASSIQGAGARFEIFLPRMDEPADAAQCQPSDAARASGTILLVEDDDAIRALGRDILTAEGYEVFDASDGASALRLLTARHDVDLVVTDIVMPGMSGVELADQIRERRPKIKVLYVTGYTDDAISPHGLSTMRDEILLKPFTRKTLLRAVLERLAPDVANQLERA